MPSRVYSVLMQAATPPYFFIPPVTSNRVRTTSMGKHDETLVTPAAAPATARSILSTSFGSPPHAITATPLYASNAAKLMALYGVVRSRLTKFPFQNPRAPSLANMSLTAGIRGVVLRLSMYSSFIRSKGARSVRTAMVLMAPAASLLAVARAALVSGSTGVTAWKPASAVSASRRALRCVRQRSCAALVIEAIE